MLNLGMLRSYYISAFSTLIALLFFLYNPQGLFFAYGSGNEIYIDRGDWFSEYIVRNTVKRNVLTNKDIGTIPVVTSGYLSNDYNFYPDGYIKYYSNSVLQTVPITIVAKLLRLDTEEGVDLLLNIFRVLAGLFCAYFYTSIIHYCAKSPESFCSFLIGLSTGSSAGLIFFSQNLYFLPALLLAPAYFIMRDLTNLGRIRTPLIFTTSLIYFLRGFEFATILALLTASCAMISTTNRNDRLKNGLLGFGLVCLAFLSGVLIHVGLVAWDGNWTLSFSATIQRAFGGVLHRTTSWDGVPVPLSYSFFAALYDRWHDVAFSIVQGWPSLSERLIILILIVGGTLRLRIMSYQEVILYIYGFGGYMSCYIFTYQHIMWHGMYEWYVFSLTLGLSFSCLLPSYVANITASLKYNKT